MLAYGLTIFAGAFLLFQVQPLMGKYILPWFGGGPGVWTTCMLFFQVVLLGGYAYAHVATSRWRPRTQVFVHLALVAAAITFLPVTPAARWKPNGEGNPTFQILLLLAVNLGLPYFVLSTTGPLLQRWFSLTSPGASPYRLYALSNLGSLLALVSYPICFEPNLTRKTQSRLWGWCLVAYSLGCVWCVVKLLKRMQATEPVMAANATQAQPAAVAVNRDTSSTHGTQAQTGVPSAAADTPGSKPAGDVPSRPRWKAQTLTLVLWVLLPAAASALLLATTNKLCQDVASIPFLWVMPLSLYLLSFIICFDSPRWYQRVPFTLAFVAAAAGVCWALFKGSDWALWRQVAVYSVGLFVCCVVCHGELYQLRPEPDQLTRFYLCVAVGGALGGVFVAIIAPMAFVDYYELNWALFLCALLFVVSCATRKHARDGTAWTDRQWRWLVFLLAPLVFAGLDAFIAEFGVGPPLGTSKMGKVVVRVGLWALLAFLAGEWIVRKRYRTFRFWRLLACTWLSMGLAALGTTLWMQMLKADSEVVYRSRNFYGVLTLYEYHPDDPQERYFLLQHGRITHGLQFAAAERSRWPTTYYGQESGVGLALAALPPGPRRVGLVGLGTGTLTTYARPGDQYQVYEINPEVVRLARSRFTYLNECAGKLDVVLGDARLSLEREAPQQFDLLVLDAFSSDSIPVHLLTGEAFELYARHLKTDGVIAVHISNRSLDLEPVVVNLAGRFDYKLACVDFDDEEGDWWLYSSTWMLLTHDSRLLSSPAICNAASQLSTNTTKVPLWTDDFTSLYQILK